MNDMSHQPVGTRTIQRIEQMKFGTELTSRGVRFRLWAPHCDRIAVRLEDRRGGQDHPMERLARGWFELEVPGVGPGARYRFVLPDGTAVPDPASRYQPEDVHGPSEVIDPRAYGWRDEGWRGRPWEDTVFYELHVGTFTREGTFAGAVERLDDLAGLGFTAIQLMPVADFRGRWNWGYDGVLHFAPDSSYGRPEDLKALVDAAHARAMMVFVDVVYNHFGPEGNYMGLYAPVLTDKHETPWGAAVNFDDDGSAMVREFVTANARYWLREFHVDGLRFDAVHAIADTGPRHLLQDLAEKLRAATDGRHIHLVLENAENEAGWLRRRSDGTPGLYTAQWSDDVHHCLHCALTGENHGYYADFSGRTDLLTRSLAEGFAYQGQRSMHEQRERGEPSAHLPPTAFITCLQNHDQIGNRPHGDRLTTLAPLEAVRAAAAINLLSPHIPLVFMGEEWGATQPFPFFSDLGPDLAEKIRRSRAEEFQHLPKTGHGARRLPDPIAEETFLAAKLDWRDRDGEPQTSWLSLYRSLLRVRREEIAPRLQGIQGFAGHHEVIAHRALKVWWTLADGAVLTMIANLSPEPLDGVDPWATGRHLWLEGGASGSGLDPWSVVVSIEDGGAEGS